LRSQYPASGNTPRQFLTAALGPAGFPLRGSARFRYVDAFDPISGIAHESKIGYTDDVARIQVEYLKDAWLLGNPPLRSDPKVAAVTWHFYCSGETGRIGPSPALEIELRSRGIMIVLHLGIP
jgi:hypothetical protein